MPSLILDAFSGSRFRRALLERQAGRRPTIGAFGVPGDILVAERERPPGRVPRHPAILEAVEYGWARTAAQGFVEPAAKIVEHDRRELSIAGVGQPQAAGDVEPWLVAPDGVGGQAGGARRLRQYVDERRAVRAPHRRRLLCRENSRAFE